MADADVTADTFLTAIGDCVRAIRAKNKAAALWALAEAEAINAGLELKVEAPGVGGPSGVIVNRRETLERTRKSIESAFSAASAASASEPRIITTRTAFR